MRTFYTIIILSLILQVNILAQAPDTVWTKTFGGISQDVGFSVIETSDGGFVVTGTAAYDVGLLKTDSNGNLLWLKTFGGAGMDVGTSVKQTADGGYIVVAYTSSFGAGSIDVWLIKTEANGIQQWAKTFGGIAPDYGFSVEQTPDGGFIIAGGTESFGAGMNDVWLIKTDANGNQQWAKTYGGTGDDYGSSLELTLDGGYVVTGYQESFSNGGFDVGFLKTDSNGNLLWLKNFGGPEYDCGMQLKKHQTEDML